MFTPIEYLDEPFYTTGGGEPTPVNGITEVGTDPVNVRMALWNQNPEITRHCQIPYGDNGFQTFFPEYAKHSTVAMLTFFNNANANWDPRPDGAAFNELDRLPIELAAALAPIPKENRGFTYYTQELPSQTGDETYFIVWVPRRSGGDASLQYESEGLRTVGGPYPLIQLPEGKNWRHIIPGSGKVHYPSDPNGVKPGGAVEAWYPGNGGIRVSTPEPAGVQEVLQDRVGGAPLRQMPREVTRIKVDYLF